MSDLKDEDKQEIEKNTVEEDFKVEEIYAENCKDDMNDVTNDATNDDTNDVTNDKLPDNDLPNNDLSDAESHKRDIINEELPHYEFLGDKLAQNELTGDVLLNENALRDRELNENLSSDSLLDEDMLGDEELKKKLSSEELARGDLLNEDLNSEDINKHDESSSNENEDSDNKRYHPLMQPENGNTKKGLFLVTAIAAITLLALCITLIILRDRNSKSDIIDKSVSGNLDVSDDKNDTTNEDLNSAPNINESGNVAVTYPPCEVTLGEYLGITVTAQKVEVTDEEIQAELDYLLSANPTLVDITDRTDVQSGDIATIDYVGTVNGVAFDGGSYNDYPLEIGAGNFIEGFEEQVIGHKLGENFDINVTFPDTYTESLAGKEAVFNITIKGLGYYEDAEVNNEFIAANTEYKTLDEYKKGTHETLLESAKQAANSKKESDIINTAINNATFNSISSEEIEAKKEEMISEYESYAGYYGIDLATFASYYFGMDEATFYEEMAKAAEIQVKTNYFLKKIIEVESIVLAEQEYLDGLEEFAQMNGFQTNEEFESYYGKEVIEDFLLTNKAYEFIINSANVIE